MKAFRLVASLAALLAIGLAAIPGARAQEEDESAMVIPDSVFQLTPRSPISYITQYTQDQSRNGWTQSLNYGRNFRSLAINVSGSSGTSEDILTYGSRNTNGDLFGRVDWRAAKGWIVSMNGRYSMSSIADGVRASNSEQRRNTLSFLTQYRLPLYQGASVTLAGNSDFQRNFDVRNGETTLGGTPEVTRAQRDSFYTAGRSDGYRVQALLPAMRGLSFDGKLFGNRSRPMFTILQRVTTSDPSGAGAYDSLSNVEKVASTFSLDGALNFDRIRATKMSLRAKRSTLEQPYADLSRLAIEEYSNTNDAYNLNLTAAPIPGLSFTGAASMNRTLREYAEKTNLNSLITSREASTGAAYSKPGTMAFVNLTMNRTRAERQASANGLTLTHLLTANFQQHVKGGLWLVGLGSASLNSYRYDIEIEVPADTARTFSKIDRDVVSAFGNVGMRFGITPRCSTAVGFSVSKVHNISLDSLTSKGNLATTIYQLNGALRLPLHRNLTIGQDYIFTATYRFFDFDEVKNDLSRVFRIDTSMADTLFPFAFLRLDHHFYFFDRGDFRPQEPGGPEAYGVAQDQAQQTLEGTVGIRPRAGVTLMVKQSMTDTQNHDLVNQTSQGGEQWNLSIGLEVNRSFWNGAGITGAVRREERYQTRSQLEGVQFKESHWLAGVTFQKEF
ncbi:MAG TPA: hypothetical protein VFS09_01165 [Candidatus Eisenbacteria bacterium]|nr:hypothetical protein [Candidatus Eisenbacteria bacterium]